jgi:hypothetical protein
MRGSLLLLLSLVWLAAAVPSYYVARPRVAITSISSALKLRNDISYLAIDLDEGTYSFNFTLYAVGDGFSEELPAVTVSGELGFGAPQAIAFSSQNFSVGCSQPSSPLVSLCPFMATLVEGIWAFQYFVVGGSTQWLAITTSTTQTNPVTGLPLQFLGMNIDATFVCAASPCASLALAVPPANGNITYQV